MHICTSASKHFVTKFYHFLCKLSYLVSAMNVWCCVLCYVMLCYVMLCYVMLCYVMLCYVMLCYVMLFDNVLLLNIVLSRLNCCNISNLIVWHLKYLYSSIYCFFTFNHLEYYVFLTVKVLRLDHGCIIYVI